MQPQWSFTSVNPSVQNPHQLWLLTIHREEEPFKRKVTFMIFKSSLHTGESQQLRRLRESIRMNGSKRKVKYSLWQKHGRCLETVTSQPIRTKPTDVCGHPPYPSCSKLECIQFHVVSMHPTANEIWLLPHDRQLIYPIQYGVRCYEARTKDQLKYWTSRFCHHFWSRHLRQGKASSMEVSNTVIRMEGFHIALNFMSLTGKKYTNFGLDDLLIDQASMLLEQHQLWWQ